MINVHTTSTNNHLFNSKLGVHRVQQEGQSAEGVQQQRGEAVHVSEVAVLAERGEGAGAPDGVHCGARKTSQQVSSCCTGNT